VSLIFSELGEPWRGAGGLNFSRWHLFSDRCHLSVNKSQVLRLRILGGIQSMSRQNDKRQKAIFGIQDFRCLISYIIYIL
jgi:hypothetical protein